MSDYIAKNIKHLRKSKNLTQDQLADKLALKRSMIGSYEEGRAVPKLPILSAFSHYFGVSVDDLIHTDLTARIDAGTKSKVDTSGKELRVLSTVVDRENKEQILLVPQKASAGYLNGYGDPDYIEKLTSINMPLPELSKEKTYRAFQIFGDSMEPVPSGSYIISEYIKNWNEIKEGKTYIVITRNDGIVYKRLYCPEEGGLLLKSDNPQYKPYKIELGDIIEIWKALGYISFTLPDPEIGLNKLAEMVYEMRGEIEELKKSSKNGQT